MPNSSIFFTSDASEYLNGGLEKRSVEIIFTKLSSSPTLTLGKIESSFSDSSSTPSMYNFKNPSKVITSPFALKIYECDSDSILICVRSNSASHI